MEPTKRPPIGLTPLIFHQENRLNEIYKAIHRFQEAGKEIPKAWIAEMESLESILDIVEEPKQPEATPKDWRILSFKRIKGDTAQAFTYNEQTGYYADSLSSHEVSLGSMLHNSQCVDSGHFAIQSVKRLSDGVVFSVGDVVNILGFIKPIEVFKINAADNSMVAWNEAAGVGKSITSLKKEKPVLFTTHDGKEIFKGDEYYGVDKGFRISVMSGLAWYSPEDGSKYFSTREAAKEYVLWNKPVLCLEDVNQLCGDESFINCMDLVYKLQDIAKSKI